MTFLTGDSTGGHCLQALGLRIFSRRAAGGRFAVVLVGFAAPMPTFLKDPR